MVEGVIWCLFCSIFRNGVRFILFVYWKVDGIVLINVNDSVYWCVKRGIDLGCWWLVWNLVFWNVFGEMDCS